MGGALEGDRVPSILRRNVVPSHMGNSINGQAERKPESDKQASGGLHPDGRGWGTKLGGSGKMGKAKGKQPL